MDSSRLLEAIIENAIDGIITIDPHGIVESINPAALVLFGYTAEEVIGNNISMLMPEPDRSSHDRYIETYEQTGHKKIIGIGREVRGLKKDGSTFPFRLSVSEVFYKNGKIFTGVVHDLTKEKQAEDELKRHALELEIKVRERTKDLIKLVSELERAKADVSVSLEKEKELNQLKSRFVSMASHEFRTPLSSVQLSASLIDRYVEKSEYAPIEKHTARIKGSVQLLNTILNDFLSLEKLEAGVVVVNKTEANIVQLGEEIAEEMQLICKKNQHIVYQHTGESSNFYVDPNLLKNSIINLVSNAIKYSGEDTFIEFSTEIDDDNLIVTVKDNGIGIPAEEQVNLFEPFFRANNTGNIPGTGLGLNIVKRYVGLMGGEMEYWSEVNQGAIFKMSFTQL
ncbi:PAS domain S-box protein [Sphingobacterium sp. DK4209]|uniref:Sensor protein FixL n=1 Tax=Sphingobacterium zhuxiongii TaxID=2662364 RepID=A0A5Q0QE38_9SPHI|nr:MULTISPECIES: PAS domain-containing sensor histidine kinase [unclassified Sphingobacterium]MVZ67558.1 PAS domain S-box protein [Sphingobacterium sp. DK4209]QGA27201.1 PAS domain S-box protein [Sphingobacterium sp. dk4302]